MEAIGTVHTRVLNSVPKGGVYAYVDVYRHFTETSGLGLSAQAQKLMDPDQARKEDEIVNSNQRGTKRPLRGSTRIKRELEQSLVSFQ